MTGHVGVIQTLLSKGAKVDGKSKVVLASIYFFNFQV